MKKEEDEQEEKQEIKRKKERYTQMESDTSSGIKGAHFIFWCLPVSMTTAALTGRAYGAALPAGGNNV